MDSNVLYLPLWCWILSRCGCSMWRRVKGRARYDMVFYFLFYFPLCKIYFTSLVGSIWCECVMVCTWTRTRTGLITLSHYAYSEKNLIEPRWEDLQELIWRVYVSDHPLRIWRPHPHIRLSTSCLIRPRLASNKTLHCAFLFLGFLVLSLSLRDIFQTVSYSRQNLIRGYEYIDMGVGLLRFLRPVY